MQGAKAIKMLRKAGFVVSKQQGEHVQMRRGEQLVTIPHGTMGRRAESSLKRTLMGRPTNREIR